jgi:hypothetical protein
VRVLFVLQLLGHKYRLMRNRGFLGHFRLMRLLAFYVFGSLLGETRGYARLSYIRCFADAVLLFSFMRSLTAQNYIPIE